jgi:hypothetical protein
MKEKTLTRSRISRNAFKNRNAFRNKFSSIRHTAVIVGVVLLAFWLIVPSLTTVLFGIVAFIGFHLLFVLALLAAVYFYATGRFGGNWRRR